MNTNIVCTDIYESEEYDSITFYYDVPISYLPESCVTGYPGATKAHLSIECPSTSPEPANAHVSFSALSYDEQGDIDPQPWCDISLPYDKINELINIALTSEPVDY